MGQGEAEGAAAAAALRLDPDPSTLELDGPFDQGKADPGSLTAAVELALALTTS